MFKRVLVAVDGSPASTAGFKAAVQFAKDQQAALTALHVIDDSALVTNFEDAYIPPGYVDSLYEGLRKSGRKILSKAEAIAQASGVDAQAMQVESHGQTVAQAIVGQARKAKADVIVIGTHGRRGLRRILMGSDAEAVVRESSVPVLLVRAAQRAPRKRQASPKPRTAARLPAPARATA